MKKALCILLCVALGCPLFSATAETENIDVVLTEPSSQVEEVVAEPIVEETLIPCEATVEDNYVVGEIMVGIKSAHSVVNKVWTAADFPEILGITSIEDLTYADTEQAVAKFSAKDNFHQLLKSVFPIPPKRL